MRGVLTLAGPGSSSSHFALITVAELKAYLRDAGLAGGAEDANLGLVVDAINRDAWAMMGGRFILDLVEWDQLYSLPEARRSLALEQRPIVSVSLVEYGYMQDSVWVAIEAYAATKYILDKQRAVLVREVPWVWPKSVYGLRVKYHAGFAAAPADIKSALCKWGKVIWARVVGDRLDKTTITREADVTTFRLSEIPDDVPRILERYALKEVA